MVVVVVVVVVVVAEVEVEEEDGMYVEEVEKVKEEVVVIEVYKKHHTITPSLLASACLGTFW